MISNAASRLFFRPNWIEVKIKLKKRFRINGAATIKGIPASPAGRPFAIAIKRTLPKEIKIKTYSTVHTGPKSHDGGAHFGFLSCEYQLYALFIILLFAYSRELEIRLLKDYIIDNSLETNGFWFPDKE